MVVSVLGIGLSLVLLQNKLLFQGHLENICLDE